MTDTAPPATPGRIITFYSYKGGAGRTMAVANTAWLLASNGLRVLMVDWDLEAPGLHRYFHPFLPDDRLASSTGVIDMIRDFAAATMKPGHDGDEWLHELADVRTHAMSVDWQFDGAGGVDILAAGRQDRSYARTVSTFDWAAFWDRLGGGAFIAAMAENMRQHWDYILVDSRTGLNDSAGICTVQLPDTVVDCFTLSTQSIDGAVSVAHAIKSQRDRRPVRILPVPMRVEDAEQQKLEAGRDYARHVFASFLPELSGEAADRYWGDVEIPYKPYFAYEEILAPFGERPHLENSLLAAFERLAQVITDGRVEELPAMEESTRRLWLRKFERTREVVPIDVVVSYTAVDRMWAEWVADVLRAVQLKVVISDIDFAGASALPPDLDRLIEGARHALVLLSHDYISSPNAETLWLRLSRGRADGRPFLIPIRLDQRTLPAPFTEKIPIDLAVTSGDVAQERLLEGIEGLKVGTRQVRPSLRFPGTPPPVWNVPQRHTAFVGRAAVLDELRDRLSASVTAVVPQSVFGLGGVGKTRLAVEYAYRFAANYDVVWWIPAEQPHMALSSLRDLGVALELPSGGNLNDAVRIVLDALRQGRPYGRWLVVFDNVDEPDDVRDLIPQGAGHVLITSRNKAWNEPERAIQVGVFERAESISLLRGRLPGLDPVDADQVADRLGDLPLAIEQAAAWLAETGMPVSEYLQLLDTQLLRMLQENPPEGYEKTTAATWLLSLDRLRRNTPAAAKLLEMCAFFAPEPIPLRFIDTRAFRDALPQTGMSLADPIMRGRLISEIGRYALATVDRTQNAIYLHRLVQAVIRNSLADEEQQRNLVQVRGILAAVERGDPDLPENWLVYSQLWPHVRHTDATGSTDDDVRQLIMDMIRYLWRRGDFVGSADMARSAEEVWRRIMPEDARTSFLGFHRGNALRSQGLYPEAREVNQQTLDSLRELLGSDSDRHPYTVLTLGGVAADLRALGEYQQARRLSELAYEYAIEAFGPDHDKTLLAANNLAVSERLVGNFWAAVSLDEATLATRERLGNEDLNTLLTASNYGHDLRAIGRFADSLRQLTQTVERYRKLTRDERHPDTLRAAKHLAITLRKTGDSPAAHDLTRKTLANYEAALGPEHPDTLACLMNRACEESALGDNVAAVATAQQVVEGFRRPYSVDHPFVLAAQNNLAVFTRLVGDHDAAFALSQHVYEEFRRTLGETHPYTLSSKINLANDQFDMNRHREAQRSDEEAWNGLQSALSPDNPDTLAAAGNLAVSLRVNGEVARADELQADTLRRAVRMMGEDHPNVASIATGRRLNCDISPPPI